MKRLGMKFWMRGVRRCVGLTLLLVVALAVYAATAGIPDRVSARALQRVDPRLFTVETGLIRWHPLRGFIVEDVKMYRKRTIGPAAVEARRAVLRLNPVSMFGDGPLTGSVKAYGALVRPAMLIGTDRDDTPYVPGAGMRKGALLQVTVADCEMLGLHVRDARARVDVADSRVQLTGIRSEIRDDERSGTVREGTFVYDLQTRALDIAGETLLAPSMLMPVIELFEMDALAELARDFEFDAEPPRCELTVRTRLTQDATTHVDAHFWMKDGRFRGVDVLRTDGAARVEATRARQTVAIGPLFVVRSEGIGTGGFTIDTERKTVEFDVASTLNPQALIQMIGLTKDGALDKVRFKGYANIAARGKIHYESMDDSAMDMTVSGRDVQFDSLTASDYSLAMRMTGRTNVLDNIRARLYDGSLTGSLTLVTPPASAEDGAPMRYATSLSIVNLNFDQLATAINPDKAQNYEGRFSLHLELEGDTGPDALDQARGHGRLRIKDGRVLMLPIFGGLTGMLSQYIPGIDFLARQDYARSEFTVADSKVKTDKATIEGNIIRIWGRGSCGLDGSLDFRVQIRFLRERNVLTWLVDVPTWVLSKFFEFQLRGTVKEPDWTPFGPTMDLLKKIGLRRS